MNLLSIFKVSITLLFFAFPLSMSNAITLIPLDALLSKPTIANIALNPAGNLLLSRGYIKKALVISVINPETLEKIAVYRGKKGRDERISKMLWIDDNSIYFKVSTFYQGKHVRSKKWLATINTKKALSKVIHAVNAKGYMVDPLTDQSDHVIFATYKGQTKKRLKIYRCHINSLIRDNFKNQESLNGSLNEGINFRTDNHHKLRFAQSYDKENITLTQWILDENDDWQSIYKFDPIEYKFKPVGVLQNGNLAVLTNMKDDLTSLYEFDLQTKKLTTLVYQHEEYDLVRAKIDENTHKLRLIEFIENGKWQTQYFTQANQKLDHLIEKSFPEQQYVLGSSSKDKTKVVVTTFSSTNRGTFYLLDIQRNKATFIGHKNDADVHYTFNPPKTLKITSEQGHTIEAYLTTADKKSSHNTLLVMPHGGPIGIRDTRHFNAPLQYLVNRGFSVLQVNYRGSTGFGKSHLDAGRGQFGQNIEEDIISALNHVKKHYNAKNTCAIGSSFGGYSSVMLAIKHPALFDCVIARFGVYDLPLIFNDHNHKDEHQIKRWERVVGENKPEELKKHSPVYLADKLKAPILITAGMEDYRASFEHSYRFNQTLSLLDKNVESLFYKKSAHGHTDVISKKHELAMVTDFLYRTLNLSLPKNRHDKKVFIGEYHFLSQLFLTGEIIEVNQEISDYYKNKARVFTNKTVH